MKPSEYKEALQKLLSKLTRFPILTIEPLKGEVWHLLAKCPYTDTIEGVYDSIHAVLQEDGVIVVSKFRAIEYPIGTKIDTIERELTLELQEATEFLRESRKLTKGK